MSLMAIVRPRTFSVQAAGSSDGSGHANLATPSPREAFVAAAGGVCDLMLDLGAGGATIDTVFLGFTNAGSGAAVSLFRGEDLTEQVGATTMLASYREAPMRHGAIVLPAPRTHRYFRLRCETAGPLVAGVVAVGRALRPGAGLGLPGSVEPGAGRPIADTGRIDRLLGGGFGIHRGAVAGGFQWTFAGLSDDERERLYALHLDLGGTSPVLVIEDPDALAGPAGNESVHWGYWTKFEPWARQQPGESKWTMQVQDWA